MAGEITKQDKYTKKKKKKKKISKSLWLFRRLKGMRKAFDCRVMYLGMTAFHVDTYEDAFIIDVVCHNF